MALLTQQQTDLQQYTLLNLNLFNHTQKNI